MRRMVEKAKLFARSNIPVMIYGETGTGKELFANLIYENSKRHDKPLVVLNCGALPENLIESTLFGTVKGAYTGAENSEGLLSSADGGTLFLDEFNSMPLGMQVKLLRFLQNKTYTRVGDHREQRSDVRIVAAMNERPQKLIQEGRLRDDLFWRLAVAVIELPPLRERMEDVPILANHFLKKYAGDVPHQIESFSPEALKALCVEWPGNVRMLENVIVRSMVLQDHDGPLEKIVMEGEWGPLEDDRSSDSTHTEQTSEQRNVHIPTSGGIKPVLTNAPLADQVQAYETALIVEAMNRTHGNVSAAAELLQINRTTLNYKVRKYKLSIGIVSPDA